MRISDWSSDVCSSDLTGRLGVTVRSSKRFRPRNLDMASGVRSGRHWSAPAYRAATTCLMLLVAANARARPHEEVNALQDDYRTNVISDHMVDNVQDRKSVEQGKRGQGRVRWGGSRN